MPVYRLALLGFGNVGRAFARLLQEKRADLQAQYNIDFLVTGIMTGRHGGAIAPQGLDLDVALRRVEQGGSLQDLSVEPAPTDGLDFVRRVPADVLFETIPVNYETGEPARTYLE
ncbi:MAG: homoserine dehydrogenase, partial [Chloroflexi bacterium]|nr:homoserine dehydrogenase [Chloroflexota bacterium]